MVLTVGVPRTAFLDVTGRGLVVWATTNTGCPPRAADDLWRRAPDGSLRAAHPTVIAGLRWFEIPAVPGVYFPLLTAGN